VGAGGCALTAAGIDQAETLWSIAEEQQAKVFSRFSSEQVETFKTVLRGLAQPL
jgi:DNA-binding MarR family transcriptional regulator